MFEYKVLTEKDKIFSGKFDVNALEDTLNSLADEGWRLADSVVASNVWKSTSSEIVFILEREKKISE